MLIDPCEVLKMRCLRLALPIFFLSLLPALPFAHGAEAPTGKGDRESSKTEEKGSNEAVRSSEEKEVPSKTDDGPRTTPVITNNPPLRGAPRGRIGGGSRGIGDDLYTLFVLAPDHVSLAVKEQPLLYWSLSRESTYPMELTVIGQQSITPLLEEKLEPPVGPGIHELNLKDHDIHLDTGVQYRWFVSIVPDPDRRSRDILAGGAIERVELSQGEKAEYVHLSPGDKAIHYAAAGFWYDSVQSVMEMTGSDPDSGEAREMTQALMRQVDLEVSGD